MILRPANLAPQTARLRGWGVYETKFGPRGRHRPDWPVQHGLQRRKSFPDGGQAAHAELDTKLILVELHAEATSEKLAMGYMLDGQGQRSSGEPTPTFPRRTPESCRKAPAM